METSRAGLQLPLVHLNGTGREELIRQYERAYIDLDAALDALVQAGPNARDYYLLGPDAWTRATYQHESRLKRLRDVLGELEIIIQALAEGRT